LPVNCPPSSVSSAWGSRAAERDEAAITTWVKVSLPCRRPALRIEVIGLFANASGTFTGTISPQGLFPRNPDGSCAVGQPSLHEVDMVAFSGTLSF